MMESELKNKWIVALRSGEYIQAENALKVDDKFCCLGVLCDIVDKSGWRALAAGEFAFAYEKLYGMYEEFVSEIGIGNLPSLMLDDFGISVAEQDKLINMNDEQNADFETIADWIEANL